MTNVGALNYKLSSNVAGFQEGMILSRSELAMTRRAMTDSRSDAEKLQYKLDVLEKAYKAGALTLEEYDRVQATTRAKSEAGREQARQQAELLQQAADLTRRLMTEEERLAVERQKLEQLRPHVSAETYARALGDLDARMPEIIAHEQARAAAIRETEAAQKRAEALVRSLMTTEERLAAERNELQALQPHLTTEQYSRALANLESRMPAAIEAERQRAAAIEQSEAAQRRAQSIIESLMTTEERLAAERSELISLQPHMTTEQYSRAIAGLEARMPAAIEAERQRAEAIRQTEAAQRRAQAIVEREMTTEERLAAERRELLSLQPHMTTEQFTRALTSLESRMPAAIEAERQRAEALRQTEAAQRRAQSVMEQFMTTEERLAAQRRELLELQPHMTTELYARALADLESRSPAAIEAERQRAEAIRQTEDAQRRAAEVVRRLMTDEERLAAERQDLKALRPHLTEEQYARAIADVNRRMPAAIDAERQRAAAVARTEEAERRAAAMTDRYMRSTQRLAQEIAEINRLERAGMIDTRTAHLARRDANRGAVIGQLGDFAGVAGMGGMAGTATQLASMAGPLAVVAGGVMVAKTAFDAATTSAMRFAAAMQEDAAQVQRLYHSASLIQTSVDGLIAFQYAAAQTVGMSSDQSLVVLTKLSAKVAEAAQGAGEAAPIFDQLGLSASQLATMDPADAMQVLFDRVSEIQNPLERARIAMKLFEEEGIKLAAVMAQGGQGMEEAQRKAAWLGLTISDFDAAGISGAVDALADFQFLLTGIVRQFTTGVWPAATAVTNELTRFLQPLTAAQGAGAGLGSMLAVNAGIMMDIAGSALAYYRTLYNIVTLDFSEAMTQAEQLNFHLTGGSSENIRNGYQKALDDAAKSAEAMKRTAEQEQQIRSEMAASEAEERAKQSQQQTVNQFQSEIDSLRERNMELMYGRDYVEEFKLANSGISEQMQNEIRQQRQLTRELEERKQRADEIAQAEKQAAEARKVKAERLQAQGDQVRESLKTDFDRLTDELAGIRAIERVGAIDQLTARRAEQQKLDEFNRSRQRESIEAPAKIARGSVEEYKAIVDQNRADRDERMRQHQEAQTARQAMVAAAQKTADAIEKLETTQGV